MTIVLPLHIAAGMLALVGGYLALAVAKGAAAHRRSGLLFVGAMTVMSLSGALMEAVTTSVTSVNVVAGLVTFYFVATAWLTVRPITSAQSWIDRAGIVLALTVSLLAFAAGLELAGRGRPAAGPGVIFGVVGWLGAAGDLRVVRAGGVHGSRRLPRHLWRMGFAMWLAAASFFWGPPNRVPEAMRIPALQAAAVLIPVAAMLYWMWRLRSKRSARAMIPPALAAFVLSERAERGA